MSARLQGAVTIQLNPSKIFYRLILGLHLFALFLSALSSSSLTIKLLVTALIVASYVYQSRVYRFVASISRLRIDNDKCTLSVAKHQQQFDEIVNQVVTRYCLVLQLQPISLGGKKLKTLYLPLFPDSASVADLQLLRRYLRCK